MASSNAARFADQTTVEAIKDIYHGGARAKVFWASLMAGAVVALTMQLDSVITKYIVEETGTTLREYVPEKMPSVYICPDQWVNATKAAESAITPDLVSILGGFMPLMGINQALVLHRTVWDPKVRLMKLASEYGPKYQNVLPFWKGQGSNIETVLSAISLDSLDVLRGTIFPVNITLVQDRLITYSGVCFRFKSDQKLSRSQFRFATIDLAFKMVNGLAADMFTKDPRFRVVIRSPDEDDVMAVSSKSFKPGKRYCIQYTSLKVNNLNTRFKPCNHWNLADWHVCRGDHGNRAAPGIAGLVIPKNCKMPLPKSPMYAAPNVEHPCNAFVDILSSSLTQMANLSYTDAEWNRLCPMPCSYTSYRSESELDILSQDGAYAELDIRQAPGHSSLEIKEHLLLDTVEMLSDVGGSVGLWVGASVISVFQAQFQIL